MGYRLHYAKHYAPDWEGGYFNWRSEDFAKLVRTEFEQNHWMNDAETEVELERPDIEEYIEKLLKKPSQTNPYFAEASHKDSYTNAEVAEVFSEMLKSEDGTIHLEWF